MTSSHSLNLANLERFSGFADRYDTHRPRPPAVLVEILTQLCGAQRPQLVVDLGSGTGLSTLIWAGQAERVIGIEPNEDMRRQAETHAAISGSNVRFQDGSSSQTGLPDACADIVTCSQSLHWMEPDSTFIEVARILRSGGVFAAYDCDWPPTIHWEVEAAYIAFIDHGTAIGRQRGYYENVQQWPKNEHLARIKDSGLFRYVKEITLHHVESGNVDRLVGIALSQGGIATLLKNGMTENEIGVDILRETGKRILGETVVPWYWSYRARLGIK